MSATQSEEGIELSESMEPKSIGSEPTKDENFQDNLSNRQDVGCGPSKMEEVFTPRPQQLNAKSPGVDFIDQHEEVTRNTAIDLGTEFTKARPPSPCGKRCKLSRGWIIILIIGTSACLSFIVSHVWESMEASNGEVFEDIWNSEISMKWDAAKRGRGLELTIVNSLSSQWDEIFVQSIKDWEAAPALSLNISSIDDGEINSSCDHVRGRMRVCNGEFGETGWLGVNELYYYEENGENYIVSSVAKMNDSVLNGVSKNEKRYVMCHEIGHGFGLPHRDEIIGNRDLGSCLDYTNNFRENMQPDNSVDFNNLTEMYGYKDARTRTLRADEEGEKFFGPLIESSHSENHHYLEGRVIYSSKRTAIFERDLGEGILKMRATVLYAQER